MEDIYSTATAVNKKMKSVGDTVYENLRRKNPVAVNKLQQLFSMPEISLMASGEDATKLAKLRLLVPKLFEKPQELNIPGISAGYDIDEITPSQQTLANVRAQAKISGVDVAEIEQKKTKPNFWERLWPVANALMRSVYGIMYGAEKNMPKELAKETAWYRDEQFAKPKSIAEMIQPATQIEKKMPSVDYRQAFKDMAKYWWQGLTNKGEMKDKFGQFLADMIRGQEGSIQEKWARDILASENATELLRTEINKFRKNRGLDEIPAEEFGVYSKSGKVLDFLMKMGATFAGSPNARVGTLMDFTLDPLVTQPWGKIFTPLNRLMKEKTLATSMGKLLKGAKPAETAGQRAIAGLGKTYRAVGRALSFTKDPIEKIVRSADDKLGYEMTEFMNKQLYPQAKKIKGGQAKFELVSEEITKWLDAPKEQRWITETVASRIPVTQRVKNIITETFGDTLNVDQLAKLEDELSKIDSSMSKYYKKIDQWYNAELKSSQLAATEYGTYQGLTPEQALRKWIKEKGGIKPEYNIYYGTKGRVYEEYRDIPSYLKNRTKGKGADELASSLAQEHPELAQYFNITGYSAKSDVENMINALKGKIETTYEAATPRYTEQNLGYLLEEDIARQSQRYARTHYSGKFESSTGNAIYDRYILVDDAIRHVDDLTRQLDEAVRAGDNALAKDISDEIGAMHDFLRANSDIVIERGGKFSVNKFARIVEMTPDDFLKKAGISAKEAKKYKITQAYKDFKAGKQAATSVLDFTGKTIKSDNIYSALMAKRAGLRTIPVFVFDNISKQGTIAKRGITETIDRLVYREGSLADLMTRGERVRSDIEALSKNIEPVLDEQGNVIKYIDRGTGRTVTKEAYEDITKFVEKPQNIETPVTISKALSGKDVEEVANYIKQDLRRMGMEDMPEQFLKENYVPYRIAKEDYPKMIKPRRKTIADVLSPEVPTYEKKRKFKSLNQRIKSEISTERNVFKLWTQRKFESVRASARRFMTSEIKSKLLNKRVNELGEVVSQGGQVYAKDYSKLTINERMFWQQTNIPELKGIYFDPEHAAILEKADRFAVWDDATKMIMNAFEKSLHLLKGYMTVANLGFHFRNFYSNFWHLYLGWGLQGLDPKLHQEADIVMLAGRPRFADTLIDLGKGNKMRAADILEQAGRYRAYNTGFVRSDTTAWLAERLEYITMPKAQRILSRANPFSRHFAPIYVGEIIGGYVENHARLAGFIRSLREGLDFESAAAKVKKFLIDYTDLSTFERKLMRNWFPFYSWYRKNLELEITQLLMQPGKFGMIPKIKNYIESLSKAPPEEYLYDYLGDLYAFRMPFGMSSTGQFMFGDVAEQGGEQFYYNPNFPWQDIKKVGQLLTGDWKGFLKDVGSSLNPMAKWPIEMLTNQEMYFERPLDTGKPVLANQFIQALAKVLPVEKLPGARVREDTGEVYLTPKQEYLTRQIPFFTNLAEAIPPGESEEKMDMPRYATNLLSDWLGIKFMPFNVREGELSYNKWLNEAIQRELTSRRDVGEKIPAQSDLSKAMKELYSQEIQKRLGIDVEGINQVKDMLKYTGSSKELDYIMRKMLQPYEEEMGKLKDKKLSEIAEELRKIGIEPTMENLTAILNQVSPMWAIPQ